MDATKGSAAAAGAVLTIGALAAAWWVHASHAKRAASPWIVHGVALGMSERDVRAHFADAPHGAWSLATGCSGLALEWHGTDPRTPTRWARFELHDGGVAGIRLRGALEPPGPIAQASPTAARHRLDNAAGTEITVVSRTCPMHSAEGEQIAWIAAAGH